MVSKAMTFPQVALVHSLFLLSVKTFLATVVVLDSWLALLVKSFLRCGVSEQMATVTSPLVSEVKPLHAFSLILVFETALLVPSAVAEVVDLAMRCGASQQLFHLVC